MADLITWKTVTAPSVAAELAEARKAQEGIGAAFEGVGSQLEDYAATKQKRQTDAFIADLNLAKNEDERNEMISAAKSGWLNMERITDASQAATKFDMDKELHADELATNAAEIDHYASVDKFNIDKLKAVTDADKAARAAASGAVIREHKYNLKRLGIEEDKLANAKTLADVQKLAAEAKKKKEDEAYKILRRDEPLRIKERDNKIKLEEKTTRDRKNLEILNAQEGEIAKLDPGSKESRAAIKALGKQLTGEIKDGIGGMEVGTYDRRMQPYREANLAASVGLSDASMDKIREAKFTPNPVNKKGDPLDRPVYAAYTSYEALLTKILKNDPLNKGVSAAAIQAKVKDITNTPAYINGKRAAESIQRSKDAVRDVREKTEATIATDVEKFHTESRNSTYVTHIFGLLQKNFPQNYLPGVITEVELREDITKVLDRVNKRYKPKTNKDKSAYAQAVYKLFSDSYAESGGILQRPDILGLPGTEGEVSGRTSARTMGMIDLSLAHDKYPIDVLSNVLSPHLQTRYQNYNKTDREKIKDVHNALEENEDLPIKQELQFDRWLRQYQKQKQATKVNN